MKDFNSYKGELGILEGKYQQMQLDGKDESEIKLMQGQINETSSVLA